MNICLKDININYIKAGEKGSNILLLHGWGSNIELFSQMIQVLSKNHVVYALDMPGFGKSDEPQEVWNVDGYTDFIIEFIKEMKIDNLSILGHSFGGRIAIKMVNREKLPFKIDKLVLLDSAGIKPQNNGSKSFRSKYYKACKSILSTKLMKKMFPNSLDKLKSKFGSEDYRNATPKMRDILVKTVNEDLTDLLEHINYETLIVWGENDTATPLGDAKIMESKIKNSSLVVVKGVGHYSFVENAVYVNTVLDDFFSDMSEE